MSPNFFHTPHLIAANAFSDYPLSWDEIFQCQAPLIIEVGFGNGDFLANEAKQNADMHFVGIDYSLGSTERLQKRLLKFAINNVRIINHDARFVLRELFPNNSVEHVIMNFPDPWPKKRHRERRMLQPSFINTLGAVLKMKGTFELVTDQLWLAQNAHHLFNKSSSFTTNDIESNPKRTLVTKYEKKWRDSGSGIYHLLSIKQKHASITRILEDAQMPHVIISKEIVPNQVQQLMNFEHSELNKLFVIKEIFSDFNSNNYLLRLITNDYDFQQAFYVLITRHNSKWMVKLDDHSSVFRTPAVKLAISKIGKALSA